MISRRELLVGTGLGLLTLGLTSCVPEPTPVGAPVERMLSKDPFTVAHRGGSVDWPEMSAIAYERSVAAGVDALEMSVARTSDGVWFGAHDRTLDRIAGTNGFVVRDHTWAEVTEHRILPPTGSDVAAQPFLTLDELIATHHTSHALWIDPKAVHRRYHDELMALLVASVAAPADVFVAKCDGAITEWGELAQTHGMPSWGFYYERDLVADPDRFAATQAAWTMLGLEWSASEEAWARFADDGRTLVAHTLSKTSQRETALARGARGLMVSGVREVIG